MFKKILFFLIMIISITGCSQEYVNNGEGQVLLDENPYLYKDGKYYGTYSHTNNEGYRPEMHLTINGGLITEVNYREVSVEGKDKITDTKYYESFKVAHNLDLKVIYGRLYNSLIKNQNPVNLPSTGDFPDINNYFKQLAESILNKASMGDLEEILLPMNDTYVSMGEPDANGYRPILRITFLGDRITAVHYSETNDSGIDKYASQEISENYKEFYGMELKDVFDNYSNQVLENRSLDPVDSISGATNSFNNINNLLIDIRSRRLPFKEPEKAE
ncbi:hypothetical protein [Alkalibacter mobilis]|uniref:hypothetical protein n=1 Tax=Alkalibacter mobilis TaxID=2787712 RepID=UPI0018A0760B|nr:hypothetical protein [Alkalibacter mobilis]MBF7096614.1 hypothetical protein [Alkalibacter mobilis]